MQEQFYTDGDVRELDGKQFECVSISYQEADGQRHNFVYNFRLKSEVDAERKVAADRLAAEEANEVPADPLNQPEVIKEETQYVK